MTNKKLKLDEEDYIILSFALLGLIIHLVFHGNLEFHRDELLYFSLGLHPDFGYASIPPFTGWIATLIIGLFGYSLFAVKLIPALMSGVFILLVAAIVKEFGGKKYSIILTLSGVLLMPFSLRVFHMYMPVAFDLTFWTAIFYFLIRYVNSKNDNYLIILGLFSGLAMLNKYLVALLIVSSLMSLLIFTDRTIFKKKKLYVGLAIALLIFLPNLLWQINQDFPAIDHLKELNSNQLTYVNRISFLKDQLIMPLGFSIIIIPGLIALFLNKKYRFIGFSSVIVILVLLILKGKSYYTIGLIPVILAYGAVFIENIITIKAVKWVLLIVLITVSIPTIPFGIPVYKKEGMVQFFKTLETKYNLVIGRTFEDGTIHSLPQDYADQLGWEELALIVSQVYEKVPDKNKTLIYAENYGQAGAVTIIGKKYNLPEAVSFSDNYFYWSPLSFDPDIETLIYINDELGEDVSELFESIEIQGQITDVDAREYGTTVYLCQKPKYSFNKFWESVMVRIGKLENE